MVNKTESADYSRLILLCLVGAVAAVLFVLLARPLFEGGVYTRDDLENHALPIRHFYAQALQNGDSFLWWPGVMNGIYVHGEGQAGMCHPVHLLLYRCLPLEVAFNGEFLFNYLWLFAGSYLMLRRLTVTPAFASLLGAVIFTFSGFSLQRFVHINAVAVVAHIPWLLWANHVVLTSRSRRAMIWAPAAVALLTGSQLLMGYPQYVWYSLIAEIVFTLACWRRWGSWRRLPLLAAAKLTGLVIGMVQLLPSADALAHSVRGDTSMDFRLSFSLHPLNILQLWSPAMFKAQMYAENPMMGNSYEMRLYAGALCTVAVAWLFVRWKQLGRRRGVVVTALAFSLVMLWMATGGYGGIYRFVAMLPVIGAFRCPTRQIVLVHLGLAIVTTIAFADLVRLATRGREVSWLRLWPMLVPIALSCATASLAWWLLRHNSEHWLPQLVGPRVAMIGAAGIALTTAVFIMAARRFSLIVYALPVLVAAEVFFWGMLNQLWLAPPGEAPYKTVEDIAASVPQPLGHVTGRLYYPRLECNLLTLNGYRLSNAYLGLYPEKLVTDTQVEHRLSSVEQRFFDFWRSTDDPLPRVRLLTSAIHREQVMSGIMLNDVAKVAIVDREVVLDQEKADVPGAATIAADRPGNIVVETDAASRQILVLSESYHEGWRVSVDGQPTPLIRAYGDYMACVVDAGKRRVEWRFEPRSFSRGLLLTQAGLLVTVGWVVVMGVVNRRRT